jgi:HSP20 family protein
MAWDPLQDLLSWHERLHRPQGQGWAPRADVYETPDSYVLVLELAGLTAEDFEVHATEDQVTVSGQRQIGTVTDGRFVLVERGQGAFSRAFSFPQPIAMHDVTADFSHGLLTVTLPKRARATPQRVDIG